MTQIQRDNYLYRSKEECCKNHFWWRVAQCMQNEHPVWFSNGVTCESKTTLEQWEVKYTPQTWESADLFEIMGQCCNAKIWWDVDGCMAASPKAVSFEFSFDLKALLEPGSCQDADTVGNALEVAMNSGFGVVSTSAVKEIGCATLSRNVDTSNPECGGCLAGTQFDGGWDGTRDPSYFTYNPDQVTKVVVQVTSECAASLCPNDASFATLYNQMIADFNVYLQSGQLQTKIRSWALERAPPVPELYNVQAVGTSLATDGTYVTPLATADGDSSWYPDFINPENYCSNDGNTPIYMNKPETKQSYIFTSKAECCEKWFSYAPYCQGGLSNDPDVEKFYLEWTSGGCSKKLASEFQSYEQGRYDTLEECCDKSWDKGQCCKSPGMGGCGTGEIIFVPDWGTSKCVSRDKATLAEYELDWVKNTQLSCCNAYFNWSQSCLT